MPILNNAVPMAVHNQIRWERDQAMQQLKDHGIPFGGVAPNVVEIVRCKDCKHQKILQGSQGSVKTCGLGWGLSGIILDDDFCSYGERRKDDG